MGLAHRRPATIVPFIGHALRGRVLLSGRVLRETQPRVSVATDSRWRNLRNALRQFATREIAGARVLATFAGARGVATTDREGYFDIAIAGVRPPADAMWQHASLTLEAPVSDPRDACVQADVLVPPDTARFAVISDIDDTVLATHATNKLAMIAHVLTSNAHTRLPLAGVAELYRALQAGDDGRRGNPLFYVSNGPWNLYGMLIEFFRLHRIPLGPIRLRDYGRQMVLAPRSAGTHKPQEIDRLLEALGELPVVLVGDSGERDPEIYAQVVRRHPGRVRAIYIRDVDGSAPRLAAIAALADALRDEPAQLLVVRDSAAAAAHAAAEGLIAASAVAGIGEAVRGG